MCCIMVRFDLEFGLDFDSYALFYTPLNAILFISSLRAQLDS